MIKAIEGRELIDLDCNGLRIRCTHHCPAEIRSAGPGRRSAEERVGVLFLNSLTMSRAATGDTFVQWAESIARCGYHAFRADLSGLGDSEGVVGPGVHDSINAGCFASEVKLMASQLENRFRLSGIVVLGHCAGAVSAVYAAPGANFRGLILLDPYFNLARATKPLVRHKLKRWALLTSIGRSAHNLRDHIRNVRYSLRDVSLPPDANTQLLGRWKQIAASGMPILLLRAPGFKARGSAPRLGEFDYIDYALKLAGSKHRIRVEFIEGANHTFSNNRGRPTVERHICNWLCAGFPAVGVQGRLPLESCESNRFAEQA